MNVFPSIGGRADKGFALWGSSPLASMNRAMDGSNAPGRIAISDLAPFPSIQDWLAAKHRSPRFGTVNSFIALGVNTTFCLLAPEVFKPIGCHCGVYRGVADVLVHSLLLSVRFRWLLLWSKIRGCGGWLVRQGSRLLFDLRLWFGRIRRRWQCANDRRLRRLWCFLFLFRNHWGMNCCGRRIVDLRWKRSMSPRRWRGKYHWR
jgi:hypothetical protein